ncbi:MAG: hypothetical protein JNM22_05510 [Saprospiraceae bacterium]|nr:hypothetical protein [Saprospiraceae bacterium]
MLNASNSQISGHNSTTVWSQPKTDEQHRYYSKHAAERRMYGIVATLLQIVHAFLAFAAWDAIFTWVFQKFPTLSFMPPVLAILALVLLHSTFRTNWETYWYDKLDDDPNTDTPLSLSVLIICCLLAAEVIGVQQFLEGQVKPAVAQATDQVDAAHATTISTYDQSWEKQKREIETVYKQKKAAASLRFDNKIRSLTEKVSDSPAERAEKKRQVASLRAQRDQALQPILDAEAAAMEKALAMHTDGKNFEIQRRTNLVQQIDQSNAAENNRYTSELKGTWTWSWLTSVLLLLLIASLSYRVVRINVKSGILPLRNYTVLDAHGSLPERIWTAISDAINRRGLQLAVWLHRTLSPRQAITTFDGTVVARPGEYNTPAGFIPPKVDNDQALRDKVAAKITTAITTGQLDAKDVTDQLLQKELELAQQHNGSYKNLPIGGEKKPEPAPASAPLEQVHPTPSALPSEEVPYHERLSDWKRRVQNMLRQHDDDYRAGRYAEAKAINASFSQPHNPIVVEGNRLNLEWAIIDGVFQVRRRDRQHWTPLEKLSTALLHAPAYPDTAQKDDHLFKQNPDLFKQDFEPFLDESGKVIGVKYRKGDGEWTTYDINTVRGQQRIYERRAKEEAPSEAVKQGLAKWNYAISLFEGGVAETETLQTVSL